MSAIKLYPQFLPSLSWRKPWVYVSGLGAVGAFSFITFTVAPIMMQSNAALIDPIMPQAIPGAATANFLSELQTQYPTAQALDSISHPYLPGTGRLISFAGDNIQLFEYASDETARSEASAIFDRAPRLARKTDFYIFLKNNVIGLYFGHNTDILKTAKEMMGSPLSPSAK